MAFKLFSPVSLEETCTGVVERLRKIVWTENVFVQQQITTVSLQGQIIQSKRTKCKRAESLHKERSVRNKKYKLNHLLKLRGERGSWRFDKCLLCWGLRRQTFDAWVWGRQAHRWSSWTSPSGSSPAPCLRTAPSETCFYMGSLCSP